MIQNERQLRITEAELNKFAKALEDAKARAVLGTALAIVETKKLISQMNELAQQIEDFKTRLEK